MGVASYSIKNPIIRRAITYLAFVFCSIALFQSTLRFKASNLHTPPFGVAGPVVMILILATMTVVLARRAVEMAIWDFRLMRGNRAERDYQFILTPRTTAWLRHLQGNGPTQIVLEVTPASFPINTEVILDVRIRSSAAFTKDRATLILSRGLMDTTFASVCTAKSAWDSEIAITWATQEPGSVTVDVKLICVGKNAKPALPVSASTE